MRKEYLGDSVYVEMGSFQGEVVLTTNNGYPDDPRNRIILDPTVVEAFEQWLKASRQVQDRENEV